MARYLLFITTDQWRGECLSILGHKVQTPNLDALAQDSMLFKHALCQCRTLRPLKSQFTYWNVFAKPSLWYQWYTFGCPPY